MICPHCGLTITKATKAKPRPEHPGPDASDAAIRKYYAAIAPAEDLKFTRRNASPELQAEIDLLLAGTPTAKDAARMQRKRRIELAEAERRERTIVRPEQYLDWHRREVTPTTCKHCSREKIAHLGPSLHCPPEGRQWIVNDDQPERSTYESSLPYTVESWELVPAADFEAKWARIAACWQGEGSEHANLQ